MLKAYKYRLYPNDEQQNMLARTFGCARKVWNLMLADKIAYYNAKFYSQIIASYSSVAYLEEHCVGSTMKNLNEKVIKSLPVPCYTQRQQETIIELLTSLLVKEQQAKEVV